jgi:SAM-dependent methyltransferase
MHLRPDNVAQWAPHLFEKLDATPDDDFYLAPRRVVHIDDGAIAAVTALYRRLLPAGGAILDLMSSWRSHLPSEIAYGRVVGLGLNGAEMADNDQLSAFTVQNLNQNPTLPFADGEFDGACCCVSVQYLQQPVAVFQEVARVLRPGAPFVVTFSNRCFPTKAVNLWRYTSDEEHSQIVALYFTAAGGWRDLTTHDASPPHGDPLYAVWAYAAIPEQQA